MRPVVEKELLHYDILFALDEGGLLKDLTFQGGTALRLCYSGSRFSEDLHFAGGMDFASAKLAELKDCIETYIGSRYGLTVTVKEPKKLKNDPIYAELRIDKWQVSVITSPEQSHLPYQKIKLEVANVPAYTREPRSLNINYPFLPKGYADMLIETETLNEILANKLVSLSATQRYVRNRDLWDIPWLLQQGATLDTELVIKKLGDYKLDDFAQMLSLRLHSLPDLVKGESLRNEMSRFIPTANFERTFGRANFTDYLSNTLTQLHERLEGELYSEVGMANEGFKM